MVLSKSMPAENADSLRVISLIGGVPERRVRHTTVVPVMSHSADRTGDRDMFEYIQSTIWLA